MAKKIVVKIGTNVLRQSDGSLDKDVIKNLVRQIAKLREDKIEVILVSSGAMATGKDVFDAKNFEFTDEVQKRQVSSAIGQPYLMREYQDLFQEHKMIVGQLLITKLDLSTRNHYLNLRHCFEGLQAKNILPIVNENDSTAIDELMFTDNDEIAGMVASMVGADELIICTNVDGIFDGDPNIESSKLLSEIGVDDNLEDFIKTNKSSFGRGGMTTKVATAQKLAKLGVKVKIINGKGKSSLIEAATVGGVGTTVNPQKDVSAKKRWLAFASQTSGKIIVNACLEKTLLNNSSTVSILPVGVTGVESPFEKGDLVGIVNESKKQIGLGIAEKDSAMLLGEIGEKNKSVVIHYNHMYINNQLTT